MMKRHLFVLALAAAFGALVSVDASACCHKKKQQCQPACAPVAYAPAPVVCEQPAPVACAQPKKHCGHARQKRAGGGLCHKKAACAPAPAVCEYPAAAPAYYYPTATPQASGQASAQGY